MTSANRICKSGVPTGQKRRVLLTCVHYRDADAVARFAAHAASLPTPCDIDVTISICDNSGDWPASTALPPHARVYVSSENRGYLRGCAYAVERWISDEGACPQWIGIMNTDLSLDDDFFGALLGSPIPNTVGVLAPNVQLPDGTRQNPFMRHRPKRLRIYAYTLIYRSMALTLALQGMQRLKSAWKRRRASAERPQLQIDAGDPCEEIYAPHGSAMFLRDTFLTRGGSLDYPGFLYGEELFIAEQARRLGLTVAWSRRAYIEHAAHTTTGGVAQRRRLRWMYESAQIAWRNDFCRR